MLKRRRLTGIQWILYPLIFFFLLLALLLFLGLTSDRLKFRRYTDELFSSELAGNTISLHYTLAYPENYGLDAAAVLPVYTGSVSAAENAAEIRKALTVLAGIDSAKLPSQDAYAYELLERYLLLELQGSAFPYYDEPFSPGSGVQSSLPILLSDYAFRRRQDVEDYLSLLAQIPDYLNGLVQYETEKAAAGLFMSDLSAEKVIEQCDCIMNQTELAEGTHFLQLTFQERLTELASSGELSEEEVRLYLAENDRLLTTVAAPAYEQLGDAFTLLKGKGTNEQGLAHFPQGRAYYEYLLSSVTGSSRSIAEIKRLLFDDFQTGYEALLALLSAYPEIGDSSLASSFDLPKAKADDILAFLRECMATDFPPLPGTEGVTDGGATIRQVSASMESYSAPAYYLTPPIDDMSRNIIYLNGSHSLDQLSLFTTLAHEGYPGHLYQTVYSQQYLNQTEASRVRYLLHYGGYVEGWAYYVENLSYEYAARQTLHNPYSTAYIEASRLSRNLHICLYSLLDIAIHYDGAGLTQVQEILKALGITDPTTAASLYLYIVEEPANYPKYYLGYLEMNQLKKAAEVSWGESFSLLRFHQFVLESGPSDFTGLTDQLQRVSDSLLPAYSPDNRRPTTES